MDQKIGENFKKIRKNKAFSQQFISKDILTQSTYSKFELSKIELSSQNYIKLLEKIEMTHEEFTFIKNGYEYNSKEKLINDFFTTPYNDINKLNKIIVCVNKFLSQEDSGLLQDIVLICEALIILNETKNIEAARIKVSVIWDRLEKNNYWYLSEIKVINTILFLFSADTALQVAKTALKNLKKYKGFQDSHKLEVNLQLNLTLLYLKNESFQKANTVCDQVIILSKISAMYKQNAAAIIRKGICLSHLGNTDWKDFVDKGFLILELMEDFTLIEILKSEVDNYKKKD